jgi:O-antigen ligase
VLYAIWWQRRFGLLLLLLLLAIAVVAIPAYLQVRAGAVGAGASSPDVWLLSQSDQERLGAWGAAWRMWLDSPLIGSGTLAFKQLHAAYGSVSITAPHNEFLRLMAETGLLVAAAFVALFLAIGRQLWRARVPTALGSLGALVAFLAAGAFNNPLLYVQVVIPMFTIIGTGLRFRSEPPGRGGQSVA